jgi:tRNA1(Val) A37 N6-methylase TrmN6
MHGPTPDESLDRLNDDWQILQLKRGHRFSTDDLVCAWRASLAAPMATSVLDIGSGIGSVGLSVLHRAQPATTLTTIEAQEVSIGLARRTVALNGLSDRVTLHQGDLRDEDVLPEGATFDLVTGSPPYIPPEKGVASPVPQRAFARLEFRGSVMDYCLAAKRWLAPGGRFCFVMTARDPRTEQAPLAAGLRVIERWDYIFAKSADPLIATLVCVHEDEDPPPRKTGRLVIRGPDGEWTEPYLDFRAQMGSPVQRRA